MPVMVLFKMGGRLSMAAINRRLNRRDQGCSGKVTLVQYVVIEKNRTRPRTSWPPSAEELTEGRRVIQNFDQLRRLGRGQCRVAQ
jgi:hypothetical protein